MPTVSHVARPSGPAPLPKEPKCHNRIRAILVHTSQFAFEGQARLATEINVSRSTICRIMSGRSSPSFRLVRAITEALERAVGRPLDPREVFSPDGTYPTPSCCLLCGCHNGCMPDEAFDRSGRMLPGYHHMKPGDWSLAPSPNDSIPPASPSTIII